MKISLIDAIQAVKAGQVIAVPTDTVYGFVAIPEAASRIYALKQRSEMKPLITFISKKEDLHFLPKEAEPLISAYWPGPLTLVLDGHSYRIPNHPMVLALLEKTGPLVSTSANLSGEPPALTIKEIESQFGVEFPILEGAPPKNGVVSTVLAFQNQTWTILREGAITRDKLKKGAIEWATK